MFKWAKRGTIAGLVFGISWLIFKVVSHIAATSPVFMVENVEIRGVSHTDLARLEKVYKPFVGKNIFTAITPSELMTEDPWVIKLEMKRAIPNTLLVIVKEEVGVLDYRIDSKCMTRTESGNDIGVECDNVTVTIAEAGAEEFNNFAKLYKQNAVLRKNNVILNKGFFWVEEDNITLVGNFSPELFAKNYKMYTERIKPRYKKVELVDLTVHGKVYVRGVLNG